jgi:hypothetical protein
MRQEIDTLDRIAIDYVLDGDQRLRQVQARSGQGRKLAEDGAAQARLHPSWTAPTVIPPTPERAKCSPVWGSPTNKWIARSPTSPVAGGCA